MHTHASGRSEGNHKLYVSYLGAMVDMTVWHYTLRIIDKAARMTADLSRVVTIIGDLLRADDVYL